MNVSFTYKACRVDLTGVFTEENWKTFEDNSPKCRHIR